MIAAFLLTFSTLIFIMLEFASPEEEQPDVPKRFRPPKHRWIHSIQNAMVRSTEPFLDAITTLKMHRKYQTIGFRSARPRRRRKKKVPLARLHQDTIPAMTTTCYNMRQKVRKNQIVTASRLHTVLDMRPRPRIATTINGAVLTTAPSTSTLVPGLFPFPNYHMKDHNQAQTPNGMCHIHLT